MAIANTPASEVVAIQPSLVVLLWDRFTGANMLAGVVDVHIGDKKPLFQNATSQFVFANMADGSYVVNVASVLDEPYYLPVDIPVTLPFPRPLDTLWNPQPVWSGYPDIVLADPTKPLSDEDQTAAYLGQRSLATLSPTTAYPFPVGATLVRGRVTDKGTPVSGALVTTSPVGQLGQFPLVVRNPDGVTSSAQMLPVVQGPVIDSFDPTAVVAGAGDFTLLVQGSGFVPGAVLKWNQTDLPTEFLSDGSLTAQVGALQVRGAGQISVTAVNPDRNASNAAPFTVAAAPLIDAIDPQSVTAGSPDITLAITGNGFAPGTVVFFNGAVVPTTFVSSTNVNAKIAAPQLARAAQLSVLVMSPGRPQLASNVKTLGVVSAPVIHSLQPATVIAGTPAFTLTVDGWGFAAGSIVELNGVALATQFHDATELTAQVTAAQVASAGQLSISVSNPNSAVSKAQTLAVATAPVIARFEPAAVTPGNTAFPLVVRGNGFVVGSVIELNSVPLSTTFVDDTQLHAHAPRSGYTTGIDGTFVLFFARLDARGETVALTVSHPSHLIAKSVNVFVKRGVTTSINIDISS